MMSRVAGEYACMYVCMCVSWSMWDVEGEGRKGWEGLSFLVKYM